MIRHNVTETIEPEAFRHDGHLKVFNHHVYEYRKGLRSLTLQTLPRKHARWVMLRLDSLRIGYLIYPAGKDHINVFLGDAECLEIVRLIGKFDLSRYTPQEDFILGIMLGYGRQQQYKRYLALLRQARYEQALHFEKGDADEAENSDLDCCLPYLASDR